MSMQMQVIDDAYRHLLDELLPSDWMSLIETLRRATDARLKQPFTVLAYDHQGDRLALPVAAQAYANTRFTVAEPRAVTNELTFHEAIFGYSINGEFRRIGPIDHLQLDEAGAIVEAGFCTHEVLREFLFHIRGRELDQPSRDRIAAIQQAVFSYLQSGEEWQRALSEFATSRGWPEGLADAAQLAYFDARTTDLKAWAQEQGFSEEEMCLAGWFELSFNKSGEAHYSVRDTHVIRIPYFRHGRIEVWRTRNLRAQRATSHKYTSWPLNRSIPDLLHTEHKLYNGWLLNRARKRTLIITEGEFKCLVASHAGALAVGIPGITEVDESIVQALVQCRAKQYIVVLDRDPRGKGMMRVDGITDSQRASYQIAVRLIRAGARNVRVGFIPDVRNGDKVGLDDLILDRGPDALANLVRNAMPPEAYAQQVGLSQFFCRLLEVRQLLKKSLDQYSTSALRGGQQVDPAVLERTATLQGEVQELYRAYLRDRFHGARRIDQPYSGFISLYRTRSGIADIERKLILSREGKALAPKHFEEDIIQLNFVPKGVPLEQQSVMASLDWLPLSWQDIVRAARKRETPRHVLQVIEFGAAALGLTTEEILATHSPQLVARAAAACQLSYWFPADDYQIEQDIALLVQHEDYWEEISRIPLVVFRKGNGAAVAFAYTSAWRPHGEAAFAIEAATLRCRQATWFFRSQASEDSSDRFRRVVDTIWPYWFERNKSATIARLSTLGITEEVIERTGAVLMSADDAAELLEHFEFRRLLNQAAQSGIVRRGETGIIRRRFANDYVLLPVRDGEHQIGALRALPLALEDHLPPALPPQPKIVRHLYGEGKYLLNTFDPEQHLYLQETSGGPEQVTILTYQELDGLALSASGARVVALNSSFAVSNRVVKRLAAINTEEIIVVLSGQTPSSRYDAFAFDDLPGYLKEIFDLYERVRQGTGDKRPPRFRLMVAPEALTHAVATHGATRCLAAVREQAVDLSATLMLHGFNAAQHQTVRKFLQISSRLRDYLEQLALPDLLDGKPIDWWARETKRLYSAVGVYVASKHGITMPSVEEYFGRLVRLEETLPIEELVRLRQEEGRGFISRPTYYHGEEGTHTLSDSFQKLFADILGAHEEVGLPTNQLSGPRYATAAQTTEKENMADNAKSIVLQYLAQVLKSTPVQDAQFSPVGQAFSCEVHVTLNGRVFRAMGMASRKKQAEAEAYRRINNDMAAAGEPLQVIDTPVEGSFSEENQPQIAVSKQPEDRHTKALGLLHMEPGDTNYLGCLNQYVQAARIKAPSYDSAQQADNGWSTTASIALPDGTHLTTAPALSPVKQATKQKAASDLIALVWAHYNQDRTE